jgi:superfamily II DNA or RNA helicase
MTEKVSLNIGPTWTYITDYTPYAFRLVEEATSAPNPQAYFSKAYQQGWSDGKYHLLKKREDKFPTGLYFAVLQSLVDQDVDVTFLSVPEELLSIAPPIEKSEVVDLRDYQLEAVNACLHEGRGILSVPTNGGKSYIAAALTEYYDVPTVVLVARVEGKEQMYKLFCECFGDVNVATEVDHGAPIVILTYTTAAKRDLSQYSLLLADEVHKVAADTFYAATMSCSIATHRFGLSGTPMGREDGKDIYFIGAIGPIIYELKQQELVAQGHSAQADIFMLEVSGICPTTSRVWAHMEEAGLMTWEDRNDKIVQIAREAIKRDMPTLILVHRLNHGEILQEEFARRGLSIPFTHGKLGEHERRKHYNAFKSGETQCLIASGIYDDSIDIPDIEVLINASGGKSKIATKQKLGRGLRNPGDKKLRMVDFWDKHHNILYRHSKKRKKNYESEGFEVTEIKDISEIFS